MLEKAIIIDWIPRNFRSFIFKHKLTFLTENQEFQENRENIYRAKSWKYGNPP